MLNLTGQRFGRLVVLRRAKPRGRRKYWRCRCTCGVTKDVRADALRTNGGTRSCGCLQREAVRSRGRVHARGERFSRLVIIKQSGSIPKRGRVYLCLCDCRKRVKVQGRHLRDGRIKSCGCWYRATRTTTIKHGQARINKATATYRAYQRQKSLCRNPRGRMARYFHDRGVKFLFASFSDFYNEVGDKPGPDYWLLRIDRDGHFEPGNLEWRPVKRHKRKHRSSRTPA
jgi:hypothetical protein